MLSMQESKNNNKKSYFRKYFRKNFTNQNEKLENSESGREIAGIDDQNRCSRRGSSRSVTNLNSGSWHFENMILFRLEQLKK